MPSEFWAHVDNPRRAGADGECFRRVVARGRVYLRRVETGYKFPAGGGGGS